MAVTNEVVHLCGRFKHFLCLFGTKEIETQRSLQRVSQQYFSVLIEGCICIQNLPRIEKKD